MIPISYNLRNLVVRKTTTVATALGLALVVFVFAGVQMLATGIKKTLGRSARRRRGDRAAQGRDAELESSIEDTQRQPRHRRQTVAQRRADRVASARSSS